MYPVSVLTITNPCSVDIPCMRKNEKGSEHDDVEVQCCHGPAVYLHWIPFGVLIHNWQKYVCLFVAIS